VVINGMGMMGMGMMGMGMMGMGMMRDVYSPVMVKLEVVAANAFLALTRRIPTLLGYRVESLASLEATSSLTLTPSTVTLSISPGFSGFPAGIGKSSVGQH
jgi:hypothetical protein